ncbi:MAG TPA: DUF917 domain-containing protein, partial [Anaerolineae bacterium]|nr:DUF917 domain-containing protein [Anaerolineae bacterium]
DELVSLHKAVVTLIPYQEMSDHDAAVMVAEFGSPKAFLEAKSFPETVESFKRMQQVAAESGQRITHLMAGELGGFNTMVPLYVAALEGVPFVDADDNGRAVPELETCLLHIYGVSHSPFTMAGANGDTIVAYLNDPMDYRAAENIARHVSMAYGQLAAFCGLAATRDQIAKLVPGSISLCLAVGKDFRESPDYQTLSQALLKSVDCSQLFVGRITGIQLRTEGGFDSGTTFIEGTGEYVGESRSIDFKNENMILKGSSGQILGTVPDLITLVDLDTLHPLTNADTREGQQVAVFGLTAPEGWLRTPAGYECWHSILEKLGYVGPYVPVK